MMATQPMDRIPQLVEKVKKLREDRDAKVKALDEAVEAAEKELQEAVAAVRGSLDEALGAIGKKRGPAPGGRKRGELMAKVEPMLARDMDAEAIAAELGCTIDNVNQAIKRIRGKRIAAQVPTATHPPAVPMPRPSFGDRAVVAAPPPVPARTNGLADEDDGASVDDLRRAVIGTKNGTKARLLTTIQRGHKHIADINRDGNGYTATSGKDGHVHAVKAFVLGAGPDGHRHDLTTEAA